MYYILTKYKAIIRANCTNNPNVVTISMGNSTRKKNSPLIIINPPTKA